MDEKWRESLRFQEYHWKNEMKCWEMKRIKGKQWWKRRKMMKIDYNRWEDDVESIKNEENHWDSKNITERMKKNVEKLRKIEKIWSEWWENRRIMMKEDGYRWEDDVEVMKVE